MNPASVGLPFDRFRPGQESAIKAIVQSNKRVFFYQAPVGSGKSAVALAVANILGRPGVVLTTDLQLQAQYARDYGLPNMEGRRNFPCILSPPRKADTGICTIGLPCVHKHGGCPYYDQRKDALGQPIYVTSYAMQIALGRVDELGSLKRELIIADEAHRLENILVDQFTIEFRFDTARSAGAEIGREDMSSSVALKAWCLGNRDRVAAVVKATYGLAVIEYGTLLQSMEGLIAAHNLENWVVLSGPHSVMLKPLDIAPFLKHVIPAGVFSVLMSGTLLNAQYQASLLRLKDDEWEWREDPMRFPHGRRPIHLLSAVRVAAKRPESYDEVVRLADRHLERHQDEKGLIHTGNYALANRMRKISKHQAGLIFYTTQTRREAIHRFSLARPPAYLVGPSLTEGLDLPYEHVTQQLMLKLPMPNLLDPWIAARMRRDPKWVGFQTASTVVQAYGRGVRAEDDWAEFWVLDANIKWHMQKYKEYYPSWFRQAIVWD